MQRHLTTAVASTVLACLCAGCGTGTTPVTTDATEQFSLTELPTPRGASTVHWGRSWAEDFLVASTDPQVDTVVDLDLPASGLAFAMFEIGVGNEIPHLISVGLTGHSEDPRPGFFIANFEVGKWELADPEGDRWGAVLDYLDWSPYISDSDSMMVCVAAAEESRTAVDHFMCWNRSQLARNVLEQIAGWTIAEGAKGLGYEYADLTEVVDLPNSMSSYADELSVRDFLDAYLPARGVYMMIPAVSREYFTANASFPRLHGGFAMHSFDADSGWSEEDLTSHPVEAYARQQLMAIWRAERDYHIQNGEYGSLTDLGAYSPPYLDSRFAAGELEYGLHVSIEAWGGEFSALCSGPGFSYSIGPSGFIGYGP